MTGGLLLTTKYHAASTNGRDVMEPTLTPHVAAHVLWYFGAGGYEPGSYIQQLLTLISRADPVNTRLLRNVYPEYVHAFHLGQSRGGIGELNRIANGDDDDDPDT